MDEKEKKTEDLTAELIANSGEGDGSREVAEAKNEVVIPEDDVVDAKEEEQLALDLASNSGEAIDVEVEEKKRWKWLPHYTIKDIVYLAIMAACMLLTGAIMPLVTQVPVFGIIQVCLGLQFSIFPALGLMKVRKPGALLFMALCSGIVLVFMFPPMFVCLLICALISEVLVLAVFRGYKNDFACWLSAMLYMPMSLPFLYVWYAYIYTWTGDEGEAVSAFIGADWWVALLMSLAVVTICSIGALLGIIINRELTKAGANRK